MKSVFLFLMITTMSFGQAKDIYAEVDRKMDKIPADLTTSTTGIAEYIKDNFKSEMIKFEQSFTGQRLIYDMMLIIFSLQLTLKVLKTK